MSKRPAKGAKAPVGQFILQVAGMVAIIGLLTATLSRLLPVNATTAGFAYLIAILFMLRSGG